MFDNKNKNHDRDRLWYKLEQWGTKEAHILKNYKGIQMSTVTFTMFKNTIFLKYMYNEATSKKCMHHKDKTKRPIFVT